MLKVSQLTGIKCHCCGIINAMKTALDSAGRLVIPKALRQALGLKPGQALEIRAGDGRLEIEIAATPMRLEKRGKGLVAVPQAKLPALTTNACCGFIPDLCPMATNCYFPSTNPAPGYTCTQNPAPGTPV